LLFTVTFTALQLCLEIYISSNSCNILQFLQFKYCVKEKEEKPDRKPYPLPYGLRNLYRNLKSENSQVFAQKLRRKFSFMNSASVFVGVVNAGVPLGHTVVVFDQEAQKLIWQCF
jgi:hypothetical protein